MRSFRPVGRWVDSPLYGLIIVLALCSLFLHFWHAQSVSQTSGVADAQFLRHVNATLTQAEAHMKYLESVLRVSQEVLKAQQSPPLSEQEAPPKPATNPVVADPVPMDHQRKIPRILLFTMDSLSQYMEKSKKGGPAGEIIVRKSLERAMKKLGVLMDVATSDKHFLQLAAQIDEYNVIILDRWTWASRGWVPKPPLVGQQHKVFILDFFGGEPLQGGSSFVIPDERFLTAFPIAKGNSFLGYYIEENELPAPVPKLEQGVIWGKDPKHYEGKQQIISAIANNVKLISTSSTPVVSHPNIEYRGHQTAESWKKLLAESKFLLGLGDPLAGPSALDAVLAGTMYINPIYSVPKHKIYHSQHPYVESLGAPYVCSANLDDQLAVKECVQKALHTSPQPTIPAEYTERSYMQRLRSIFGGLIQFPPVV